MFVDGSCGYSYTNPSVRNLIASNIYWVQSCSSSDLVSFCAADADIEDSWPAAWCCWEYGDELAILGSAGNKNAGRMPDMVMLVSTTKKPVYWMHLQAYSVT